MKRNYAIYATSSNHHQSSSSSQFDTFRSKQITAEKFMNQIFTGQSEDANNSEVENNSMRSEINHSFRNFTSNPIDDFSDKENQPVNPYKRTSKFNITYKGKGNFS